jgi:membrane protein implicated in regulation of membrane protease activity
MSPDTMTWLWLLAGILLVASELFLPGLVAVFLGLGAMLVALLRWLGLIDGLAYSFTAWFVSSLALLVVMRSTLQRFVPSETSFTPLEEDVDLFGAVAEVVETVSPEHKDGRISFQGTTWPATSDAAEIPPGAKVTILYRENLGWRVQPCDDADTEHSSVVRG